MALGAARVYWIDLPAQNVADALTRLSEQTDVQVLFPYAIAEEKKTQPLKGEYTLLQALDLLLQGTGLSGGLSKKSVVMISEKRSQKSNKQEEETVAKSRNSVLATIIGVLVGAGGSQGLVAQENDRAGGEFRLEEIVVTARKRSESIQSVPLSVSALDSAAIEAGNIKTLADIKEVPNVEISTTSVQPTGAVMYIRGIGNKAQEVFIDPPVAVSIDGVYLATSSGALIDLFDVQQVEILRGPQGTLQGRNSPGGAVNVTTRRPTGETSFDAELGYSRFNTYEVKLAGETAIIDDELMVRASILSADGDGQVRNLHTGGRQGGRDLNSGRLSVLYTPTESFDLFVSADYTANRSDQTGLRAANTSESHPPLQPTPLICILLGECSSDKPYTTRSDYTDSYHANLGGISATANLTLNGATLTSVTGYRFMREDQQVDIDGYPFPVLHVVDRMFDIDTYSQELRIASDPDGGLDFGGKLDWLLGIFYYRSKWDLVLPVSAFGGPKLAQYADQTLDSYAVFGQSTYHFSEKLSISGGFRQSWDQKKFSGVQSGFPLSTRVNLDDDWSNFSFETGLEYQITPDHLLYGRFSQGYRSGGIDSGVANPADVDTFDAETVDAYEIGAKTEWFDRRLIVNLALFYNDYDDLQTYVLQPSQAGSGFSSKIENAASASIKGVEMEVVLQATDNLTMQVSLGYLDAEYRDYVADLIGNGIATDNSDMRLPFTPKRTASFIAGYTLPFVLEGSLTLRGAVNYKSKHTLAPLDIPVSQEDGYTTADVSLRYDFANKKVGFELYVQNMFDSKYLIAGENVSNLVHWQVDGQRRNYGGRIFLKF